MAFRFTRLPVLAIGILLSTGFATASADIIKPVSGVTDNPDFGGPGGAGTVAALWGGTIFDFNDTPANVMDWMAGPGSFGGGENWQEWNGSYGPLRFDLGAAYDLTNLYVWNYTHGNNIYVNRQIDTFDVYVSNNNVDWTLAANADLPKAPTIGTQATNAVALSSASGVRYVKFDNMVSYGEAQAGLNEIRFEATVAGVPEPSSLALAALGLLGLGGVVLRKHHRRA